MNERLRVTLSFGNSSMEMHLCFDNMTKEEAKTFIALANKFNGEDMLFLEGWGTEPMEEEDAPTSSQSN